MVTIVLKYIKLTQRVNFNIVHLFELLASDYLRGRNQKVIVQLSAEDLVNSCFINVSLEVNKIYQLTFTNEDFIAWKSNDGSNWRISSEGLREVKGISGVFPLDLINSLQNEVNSLKRDKIEFQNQLNIANTKISKAEVSLGINSLNDLEEELRGENDDEWTIRKWKEELKIEKELNKRIDNFYRQNPPSEDTAIANILEVISDDYLNVSRENKQRQQEVEKLKEIINSLESLVVQDEDNFLLEKIINKSNQLEELKVYVKRDLDENVYEILEDILETQKVIVKNNDNLTLNQLRKFKQRLLSSGQINKEQLNKVCQIQSELSFLELKLEQQEKFQARVEVNRNM